MTPASGDGTLDLFSSSVSDPGVDEAEDSTPRVWSVSELNRSLRSTLERGFPALWVSGEVGGWTRARSGHCYFTLKDDRAQLRCVMWRREAARLPADPEEGMTLRAFGQITMYEARGELQLQVRELEGEGREGLWKLAFERLRAKLDSAGLLDPARKRPLPSYPRCVGVVTSPTGAAFRDILSVIGRRAPWTRVLIRGARVQGEGAAEEVAAALRILAASGKVDVIVVGRGGGSIEDLWAFNEEPVARAIAESPVPVVSAVGHETDVTISDLVADLRAPTPSAAAEAVVQDRSALLEALNRVRPRLARSLRSQVERRATRLAESERRARLATRRLLEPRRAVLDQLKGRLVPAMTQQVAPRRNRLAGHRERLPTAFSSLLRPLHLRKVRADERLRDAMQRAILRRRDRLATAAGRIEALSPLSTLRRGYAVPLGPDGRVLRSVQAFQETPRFHLRVVDGRVECQTRSIEPDGAAS